jgi:hypothetical protein
MGWACNKSDENHTIFGCGDCVKSDHTLRVWHTVLKVNGIEAEIHV